MAADIVDILAYHRGVVDGQDDVAFLQSGLISRHSLIRLVDDNVADGEVITYERAYAAYFPDSIMLKSFVFSAG